jgi:hypothetical protein
VDAITGCEIDGGAILAQRKPVGDQLYLAHAHGASSLQSPQRGAIFPPP